MNNVQNPLGIGQNMNVLNGQDNTGGQPTFQQMLNQPLFPPQNLANNNILPPLAQMQPQLNFNHQLYYQDNQQ